MNVQDDCIHSRMSEEHGEHGHYCSECGACWECAYLDLSAQLAAVTAREEQAQVQLAGCGAAALGATDPSQTAKPGDYGWSASYGDVLALRLRSDTLRAQLAAVTKERDEARMEDRDVVYRRLLRERDALKARVAALEAALAPTCEIVEATLAEAMALPESVRISVRSITELVLAAVRARAGLDAKEGS